MMEKQQNDIVQHTHPESLMMTYGYDPALSEGAIKPPVFQTSTFVFKTAEEGKSFFELAAKNWVSFTAESIILIWRYWKTDYPFGTRLEIVRSLKAVCRLSVQCCWNS